MSLNTSLTWPPPLVSSKGIRPAKGAAPRLCKSGQSTLSRLPSLLQVPAMVHGIELQVGGVTFLHEGCTAGYSLFHRWFQYAVPRGRQVFEESRVDSSEVRTTSLREREPGLHCRTRLKTLDIIWADLGGRLADFDCMNTHLFTFR